jgi:tetratricopeptide (TPR) repeat protein
MFVQSIPYFTRAIELDGHFALAYHNLAATYNNTSQPGLAAEYAERAFRLRDRVSEREKLRISAFYYRNVAGDLDRALAETELLNRTYPRDAVAQYLLGNCYRDTGQYEHALKPYQEACRLDPKWWAAYRNLGLALIRLNRFDEAKEVIDRALAQQLDGTGYHTQLYQIAFVRGDETAMRQQLDWAREKPEEYQLLDLQARTAACAGQYRQAGELSGRATRSAEVHNLKEPVGRILVENALHNAVVGSCSLSKEDAARALALSRREFAVGLPVQPKAAMALALCGDVSLAQLLGSDIASKYPQSTLSRALWLPMIRAAIEVQRKKPDKVIQLLQPVTQYEAIGEFWPIYLRGEAYLRLSKGSEAAAEFQKILDHRGWNPVSPLYPLAHLGLARASALMGDVAHSRKKYEEFLTLWQGADPDHPMLVQAKREYLRLR